MSYLDLAKQIRARQSAPVGPYSWAADAALADELNELTKELPRPVDPTAGLRAAYGRRLALTVAEADGRSVDLTEVRALDQAIVRLTDDAGPLWADAVFTDTLRRFRWATGRCGLCGGLGHTQAGA